MLVTYPQFEYRYVVKFEFSENVHLFFFFMQHCLSAVQGSIWCFFKRSFVHNFCTFFLWFVGISFHFIRKSKPGSESITSLYTLHWVVQLINSSEVLLFVLGDPILFESTWSPHAVRKHMASLSSVYK